jgi:hypothetical protein
MECTKNCAATSAIVGMLELTLFPLAISARTLFPLATAIVGMLELTLFPLYFRSISVIGYARRQKLVHAVEAGVLNEHATAVEQKHFRRIHGAFSVCNASLAVGGSAAGGSTEKSGIAG